MASSVLYNLERSNLSSLLLQCVCVAKVYKIYWFIPLFVNNIQRKKWIDARRVKFFKGSEFRVRECSGNRIIALNFNSVNLIWQSKSYGNKKCAV